MGKKIPFYITYLSTEFEKKKAKNPRFSLRAFSQWLEVDPSLFSKILSRQNIPSLKMANKMILKLNPDDTQLREKFLKSVSEENACKELHKLDSDLTDCL